VNVELKLFWIRARERTLLKGTIGTLKAIICTQDSETTVWITTTERCIKIGFHMKTLHTNFCPKLNSDVSPPCAPYNTWLGTVHELRMFCISNYAKNTVKFIPSLDAQRNLCTAPAHHHTLIPHPPQCHLLVCTSMLSIPRNSPFCC